MRKLTIVILLALAIAGQSQNLTITSTMVGVSLSETPTHNFQGNNVEADSIVFQSTCDPYQANGLTSQEIEIGDTLWFPRAHYLRGYIRAYWSDHNLTCPIANVQRDGDNQPIVKLLEMPGFGSQMNLPILSNAASTRVIIISPVFGMVYYKNFQGVEGQENTFTVSKFLPPGGKYTMFVRAFYTDQSLCKPSTGFSVGFVVVD